jgi:hypothetical protein
MIKYFGIIAFIHILINSTEFRNLLHLIKLDYFRHKHDNLILFILSKFLSCTKCTTFWTLLFIYDIYLASIGALIQLYIDRIIGVKVN